MIEKWSFSGAQWRFFSWLKSNRDLSQTLWGFGGHFDLSQTFDLTSSRPKVLEPCPFSGVVIFWLKMSAILRNFVRFICILVLFWSFCFNIPNSNGSQFWFDYFVMLINFSNRRSVLILKNTLKRCLLRIFRNGISHIVRVTQFLWFWLFSRIQQRFNFFL